PLTPTSHSTLPYTTLFRSLRVPERAMLGPARKKHWSGGSQRLQKAAHANQVALLRHGANHPAKKPKRDEGPHLQAAHRECHRRGDRKSTRLNSSHVSISYA